MVAGLLRSVHNGARSVLGERAYARLRQIAIDNGVGRKLALAEFEARDVGPNVADLRRLDEQDKAITLGLGVQYAYYSYVEGDIIEFGTCTGLTARMLARAMIASERDRPQKSLHLFDSFEGHPEIVSDIDRNSFEVKSGIWRPGFPRLLSESELISSCGRIIARDRIFTYAGWFRETIERLEPSQKFAFIHSMPIFINRRSMLSAACLSAGPSPPALLCALAGTIPGRLIQSAVSAARGTSWSRGTTSSAAIGAPMAL